MLAGDDELSDGLTPKNRVEHAATNQLIELGDVFGAGEGEGGLKALEDSGRSDGAWGSGLGRARCAGDGDNDPSTIGAASLVFGNFCRLERVPSLESRRILGEIYFPFCARLRRNAGDSPAAHEIGVDQGG